MVEGGRIDHALHDTKRASARCRTPMAFDDAIKAAIAKMKLSDPELKNTLIVVTADHDHTMVLNGYAARTGKTDAEQPRHPRPGAQLRRAEHARARRRRQAVHDRSVFGNGENRIAGSRSAMTTLTDAVGVADNYHQEAVDPRPASAARPTAAPTSSSARSGLGADTFHGIIDNTGVFGLVKHAAGL